MIERRLTELGIELPPTTAPSANFLPAVRSGQWLFVSGHTSTRDGVECYGKVGSDVDLARAQQAAREVAISMLGTMRGELGDLDRVRRIVKVFGMVNSAPDFEAHGQVINGASDLFVALFGDRGRHARSSVGMAQLPRNASVELELIAEIEE
jgi:enamine deaminase RidA (YjgF/YER057c/UK114 family)